MMKKLFQHQNIQNSIIDTVTGIVKNNKTPPLFTSPSTSQKSTSQSSIKEKDTYLRLPYESARRLRWYDKNDLSQITRLHLKEKQQLINLNEALKNVITRSGIMTLESLDDEIKYQLNQVDFEKMVSQGVTSVLCVSAEAEIIRLRDKLHHLDNYDRTSRVSESLDLQSETCTQFSYSEDIQYVKVNINVGSDGKTVKIDLELTSRENQQDSKTIDHMLKSVINSLNQLQDSKLDTKSLLNVKTQISSLIGTLNPISEMQGKLIDSQNAIFSLENQIKELKNKKLSGMSSSQLPDVLVKAQDMCLAAEERVKEAIKRAEMAEIRTVRAERGEAMARNEISELKARLEASEEAVKEIKMESNSDKSRLNKAMAEYENLKKQKNELREEYSLMSKELDAYTNIAVERDELFRETENLKEKLSELKVLAEKEEHYKKVARELEAATATAQENSYIAAAQITKLEMKLKDANAEINTYKAKWNKSEDKYRKLKKSLEVEMSKRMNEVTDDDRSNWPEAAQNEIMQLESENQTMSCELEKSEKLINSMSKEKENQININENLKEEVSQLQEKLGMDEKKFHTDLIHFKKELLFNKNELEQCRNIITDLEKERQKLYNQLHIKAEPMIGYEDCRGGGSFHDCGEMPMAGHGFREGLSGIDTLYLKNILFKFIEAVADGKVEEEKTLLPAISTLLEASPLEFKKLQDILMKSNNHRSYLGFSLFK